jgi:hypothetical protein
MRSGRRPQGAVPTFILHKLWTSRVWACVSRSLPCRENMHQVVWKEESTNCGYWLHFIPPLYLTSLFVDSVFSLISESSWLPHDHLLLDSAPNIGPLISRWELDKFKNCLNKSFRTSKVLTLLYQQFLNLLISQRDMSGPRLGALSKNRWSGGSFDHAFSILSMVQQWPSNVSVQSFLRRSSVSAAVRTYETTECQLSSDATRYTKRPVHLTVCAATSRRYREFCSCEWPAAWKNDFDVVTVLLLVGLLTLIRRGKR